MSAIDAPLIPDVPVYQLSVGQYHEMIRSGLLTSEDRVELLHGWMVPKISNNPPHSVATELTVEALRAVLPAGYSIRSEKPITLSDSEPEPDVVVVAGDVRRYAGRHPGPDDIALVVEISDSILSRDREIKKRIYAEAGIRCYWIVDLHNRRVEVHSDLMAGEFSSAEEFTDRVPLHVGNGPVQSLAIAEMLP